MYKAAVRALLRHSIKKLNQGDYSLLLRMASPDLELVFPGNNSWSSMFRSPTPGRHPHATHRGVGEVTAFADRFVAQGIQFEIEDVLVNGGPWKTRVAMQAHDYIAHPAGGPDIYANRAVLLLEIRWGRLVRWEDYEDTERVAALEPTNAAHLST